ncbi:MAG: DUF4234 domain-containing protein [Lachnospiraceae bacterium]|nr:DUF4234 domain-containing protein [Lachnospiraceae bacterium]
MKYCQNCGAELADEAVTCPKCGAALGGANVAYGSAPANRLKTNRSLLVFILLNAITLGIYGLIAMSNVGESLNCAASKYDGKKTMHYCLLFFIVGPLTLEIGSLVWFHNMSSRVGNELKRRGIDYSFGAGTFWGWNVLGLLILVGPLVYTHKLFKAMNLICEDYNVKG